MNKPYREAALLKVLPEFPNGATAKELAPHLGWKPVNTSQALGQLFDRGAIDRENISSQRTEYRYRTKLPKVSAPPAADVAVSGAPQPAEVE